MSLTTVITQNNVSKAWTIGMRRVNRFIKEENVLGFKAYATGMHSELPDILVISEIINAVGQKLDWIIRVYECTNYKSPESYIQLKRAWRYRNNLLQFKAEKIFVCSYEKNLRFLPGGKDFFEQDGIAVRIMGYQD